MKSTSRMFKALLGGILLLVFVLTGQALAQGGNWETKTPMPTARAGVATGIVNGKLYVVSGGVVGGYESNVNEAYDPASNTWTDKGVIPTPRAYAGAAGIDGKLYVVGGCRFNGNCGGGNTNILEEYDEATNSWATKAAMPTARSAMAIGAIDGKLYVVGGNNGVPFTPTIYATLERYDPVANAWTTMAPMPTARSHVDGAVIDGKLYVVGGATSSEFFATLQVYDPGTDTWATKTPMPAARYAVGTAAVNGILYAVGGANPDTLDKVEAYDPATDSWTTVASIPTARYLSRPQVINGVLYVAGNGPGNTAISTLEAFTPAIVVPFAAFTPKVEIETATGKFEVKAPFTLGAGSNGIDPVTEIVALELTGGTGSFSTTIPAGSFQFFPAKFNKKGKLVRPPQFKFEGVINGVALEAKITDLGNGNFEFKAEGTGANLAGLANPVTVTLTVGDDGGSTNVEAEFE